LWSKPAAREREAEAARLEGEAGNLWNVARLEALTVYLGPVEKIDAKGPKTHPGRMGFAPQNTLILGMIS
jgi:hypothetical protein